MQAVDDRPCDLGATRLQTLGQPGATISLPLRPTMR
jgi:hypothetical protein